MSGKKQDSTRWPQSKKYLCAIWGIAASPIKIAVLLSTAAIYFYYLIGTTDDCILWFFYCTTPIDEFWKLPPNEMGDTLSGLAGAVILVWVVASTFMQSKELREQRLEFAKTSVALDAQRFELTFFEILSTFGEIVNAIDLIDTNTGRVTKGRDCFKVFYRRLNGVFREKQKKSHTPEEALRLSYQSFWNTHQSELGHYFRFLYNALRVLSESPHAKMYHARLLRSQLSDRELLLIFYNCLSLDGQKFLKYAAEFAIFDNLPVLQLLEREHADLVDRKCFGQNPMPYRRGNRAK